MKYYLTIQSRTGHFNWANPSEEYTSTVIALKDSKTDKTFLSTSLRTEYDESESVPEVEKAICLLEDCIKKMFIDTSRQEKEKLLALLKENQEKIDEQTILHRIKVLKKEIKQKQNEVKSLKELNVKPN